MAAPDLQIMLEVCPIYSLQGQLPRSSTFCNNTYTNKIAIILVGLRKIDNVMRRYPLENSLFIHCQLFITSSYFNKCFKHCEIKRIFIEYHTSSSYHSVGLVLALQISEKIEVGWAYPSPDTLLCYLSAFTITSTLSAGTTWYFRHHLSIQWPVNDWKSID